MYVLINIPESVYRHIQENSSAFQAEGYLLENAILNGIGIPKGSSIFLEKDIVNFLRCEDYPTCDYRNCSDCNKARHITGDNLHKVMRYAEE